jgi:transcriptional regulator with XRE-family HTH domain
MDMLISSQRWPPAQRTAKEARQLWMDMRKAMSVSHLAIFVYAGPSEGVAVELQHASDFRVPVILLVRDGRAINETLRSPFLRLFGEFKYRRPADAVERIRTLLTDRGEEIQQAAYVLDISRRTIRRQSAVGNSIASVRNSRGGTSREELARQAGLREESVASFEDDFHVGNPPWDHLAAVAGSLDRDVFLLCQSPEEAVFAHVDREVTRAAYEWDWTVRMVDDFRNGYWRHIPASNQQLPTKEAIRRDMRRWREVYDKPAANE